MWHLPAFHDVLSKHEILSNKMESTKKTFSEKCNVDIIASAVIFSISSSSVNLTQHSLKIKIGLHSTEFNTL